MSDNVVVHGFETSNNFKVRIALGFKGIPFEFVTIDPADRSGIQGMSGQPLTPVMVHGDVVMFDSAAILRYLEANFPDTPKLFSTDPTIMREIESWETYCRVDLHGALWMVVEQRITGQSDPEVPLRAAELFAAATARLEERLDGHDWLVDDRVTAADVAGGATVHRVRNLGAFDVPEDRPRTYAWSERVMAFDPGAG